MEITNDSHNDLSINYELGGINANTNPTKSWRMIGSNIGGRSCYDFSNVSKTIFTDTPLTNNINTLNWTNPEKGKILLATIFFTPKGSGTVTIGPQNESNTKIKSFNNLNNLPRVFLNNYEANNINNFDNLEWIIKGIANEKMCISKDANNLMKIWWNQDYLNELISDVSEGQRTNCFYN